jgi:hypothetical protein
MRRFVLVSLVVAALTAPGCKREPEPPPPATPTAVPRPQPTVAPLELPMTNSEIGITVTSLPEHLVAAYNDGPDIMLAESVNRKARVFLRFEPNAGPLDPQQYHERAKRLTEGYGGGRQTAVGVATDGPFGTAAWSASHFFEDGTYYDQVELVTPHPSAPGLLVLRAKYPEGQAEVPDKLLELQELLTRIAPATG